MSEFSARGGGVFLNFVGGGMPLSSWNPLHYSPQQGLKGGGGSLELWRTEIFAVEPGAQGLSVLGARTKIMISAKWSSRVQPWSPRPPIFFSWSPEALHFLVQSPGVLSPFGTLTLCSAALRNYFRVETPKLPILSETPDKRPKCFDSYSRPQSKRVKNHTLHNRLAHREDGTYT